MKKTNTSSKKKFISNTPSLEDECGHNLIFEDVLEILEEVQWITGGTDSALGCEYCGALVYLPMPGTGKAPSAVHKQGCRMDLLINEIKRILK